MTEAAAHLLHFWLLQKKGKVGDGAVEAQWREHVQVSHQSGMQV